MKMKTDWNTFKDVRRCAGPEVYHTSEDIDCRVSANVGDIMAGALAAAGAFALCIGGCTPCETDYLAASGAVFPPVPVEELEHFNRETMHDFMDEAAEHERYRKIAKFFHGR